MHHPGHPLDPPLAVYPCTNPLRYQAAAVVLCFFYTLCATTVYLPHLK
jgi:hypothetical protein